METLHFKYARRGVYGLTYTLGILVITMLCVLLVVLMSGGENLATLFELSAGAAVAVIAAGAIVLEVLAFLVPGLIALRLSEARGSAVFEDTRVVFRLKNREVAFGYADIRKAECAAQRRTLGGVAIYRLTVRAGKRLILTGSYRQARRRHKTGESQDIYRVYETLCQKARLPAPSAVLETDGVHFI
jgi:hypothetical protein